MEALGTILDIEQDQSTAEKLILDYVSELKRPVEITRIQEHVLSNNPIADYEIRFALSRLLASRKLILDDKRRIKLSGLSS
jgi:hypothetical protein